MRAEVIQVIDSDATRRRVLAIAALLLVVGFAGVVSAAEHGGGGDSGLEWLLWGPLILFGIIITIIGIVWAVGYPIMLAWAVLFSGKKLDDQIADTVQREGQTLATLGRDPLTTIDGGYRTNITSCGIVWAGVVYGPSHWFLLRGFLNNLIGGSIDVFQKVVSAGRAEAMQRLREQAVAHGYDDVINVRIDTSNMAPQGAKSLVKAVEIFAYGTGVKYG